MATTGKNAGKQDSYRQFDTRGMFVFISACCVYLAVIVSLGPAFDPYRYESPARIFVTLPAAWIFFWWLYRKWRLPHAVIVHNSGLVLVFGFLAFLSFIVFLQWMERGLKGYPVSPGFLFDPTFHSQLVAFIGRVFLVGCGLGTLMSFPLAVLMLVYLGSLASRRNRSHKKV